MQLAFTLKLFHVAAAVSALDPEAAHKFSITLAGGDTVTVDVAASAGRTAADLATAVATAMPDKVRAVAKGNDIEFYSMGANAPVCASPVLTSTEVDQVSNMPLVGAAALLTAVVLR